MLRPLDRELVFAWLERSSIGYAAQVLKQKRARERSTLVLVRARSLTRAGSIEPSKQFNAMLCCALSA